VSSYNKRRCEELVGVGELSGKIGVVEQNGKPEEAETGKDGWSRELWGTLWFSSE